MVRTPSSKAWTLEEFLKLPETKPATEYIDGKIIQKPMPQGKHSAIQGECASAINAVVKAPHIARASVFTWERVPCDANGEIANVFLDAPDWTIEILSPEQSQTKITKNILHCLKHGTQMGWLIDPDEQTVFVYIGETVQLFDEPQQQLPVPPFANEFKLTVGDLFGWLLH